MRVVQNRYEGGPLEPPEWEDGTPLLIGQIVNASKFGAQHRGQIVSIHLHYVEVSVPGESMRMTNHDTLTRIDDA